MAVEHVRCITRNGVGPPQGPGPIVYSSPSVGNVRSGTTCACWQRSAMCAGVTDERSRMMQTADRVCSDIPTRCGAASGVVRRFVARYLAVPEGMRVFTVRGGLF
jgi:hypothetical protein